ncbi:MAG: hypothetical protein ACI4ES_11855 [Roseburia sp.]
MLKEQITEETEIQRRKISMFDEEIRKNEDIVTSGMLVFWIYVVIECLLFFIPVGGLEEGEETIYFYGLIFSIGSAMLYIRRYLYVMEERKNIPIWRKCRYLPISKKEFLKSRLQYLNQMLWKCVVVAVMIQCGAALFAYGKLTIWNLLYPIVVAGILPYLTTFFSIVMSCRDVTGKGRRKQRNYAC